MNNRISKTVLSLVLTIAVAVLLVYRINSVANNRAPVEARHCLPLSESVSLVNTTSCVTGKPCTYADVVDFRVIVLTFNRADSLSKLLRSLDTLVLDGDFAAVEIWIDRDRNGSFDQRTFDVASKFSWKGGPTRLHVQVRLLTVQGWKNLF